MKLNENIYRELSQEIPGLEKEIRRLYQKLDKKTGLKASLLPITFGYEQDVCGSFTRSDLHNEDDHGLLHHRHTTSSESGASFHFSLLFLGSRVPHPLSPSDREDLYKHEYAHYMETVMDIPKEYRFRPGLHGSAWQYCCSLIGAAPTPFFEKGKGEKTYDYEKLLKKKPTPHPSAVTYQTHRELKTQQNRQIKFQTGDPVDHPKYGHGVIEEIKQTSSSVRLAIRFPDGLHTLDQTWLIRNQYGFGNKMNGKV